LPNRVAVFTGTDFDTIKYVAVYQELLPSVPIRSDDVSKREGGTGSKEMEIEADG
jgi:hypothetical protein